MGLDNKTIQNYLGMLQETGMIDRVSKNRAGSSLLKHTEKIYLDNPDLYHAIINEIGYESKTGTLREIFFIKMLKNAGEKVYYSSAGDFEVNGAYLKKDDTFRIIQIGHAMRGTMPWDSPDVALNLGKQATPQSRWQKARSRCLISDP